MRKICLLGLVALTFGFSQTAFAQIVTVSAPGSKDCEALMTQIDRLADKLPVAGQHLGKAEESLEAAERDLKSDLIQSHPEQRQRIQNSINSLKNSIASENSSISKLKLSIANLVEKLCACCAKKSGAHGVGKECEALMTQIDRLADKLPVAGQHLGKAEESLEAAERDLKSDLIQSHPEQRQRIQNSINSLKNSIASENSSISKLKLSIANLVEKLCACCAKMPYNTSKPPPTEHALKTQPDIFELEFGYNYIYAPEEDVKDLHGFNASLFVNVNSWLAFGGEFMAGFGDETQRFGAVDIDTSLERYVYVFGPKLTWRPAGNFSLFAKAMAGGVHDNTDVTVGGVNTSFSANAFAFTAGGGADLRLNSNWSWRIVEADYLGTNFGHSWQDNMRVTTGIVFTFGGRKAPPVEYSKEAPISVK